MLKLNFSWLPRLGRVIFVFLSVVAIFASFTWGTEMTWGNPSISITLLYTALGLLFSYVILVLVTKIILYITKGENFLRAGFQKKHYYLLALPIALSLAGALIFAVIVEPLQAGAEQKRIESAYNEAVKNVDSLKEELRTCAGPVIEEKYAEESRSCNLRKNKVKHDYDFCVSLYSVTSPASCLYDHDYESIDCSEETLHKKAQSKVTEYDLPTPCQTTYHELQTANDAIEAYNALNSE